MIYMIKYMEAQVINVVESKSVFQDASGAINRCIVKSSAQSLRIIETFTALGSKWIR